MDEPKNHNGLPESVLPLLRKAGWAPGRAVPVDSFVAAYRAEGLPWTNEVEEFLREFGDLVIVYTTKFESNDVLEFCAQRAALGIGRVGLKEFEELSGRRSLCPVGHYQFGTCLLLMAGNGEMLGGTDEAITFIGKSGKDAIGNILIREEASLISQFPSFVESAPATAESTRAESLKELDALIDGVLGRHGFTRAPQKKSVSWILPQALHKKGQSNVIFKLLERKPMTVRFGVRKEWLKERAHIENAVGEEEFSIGKVHFAGLTVTNDQRGRETILKLLEEILS